MQSVSIALLEGGLISGEDPVLEHVTRADLRGIYADGLAAIAGAGDLGALEVARVRFLGRKSDLVLLLRSIADLPPDERREVGKSGHQIRCALEASLEERRLELENQDLVLGLGKDRLDITLPGWRSPLGRVQGD